VYRLNRTGNRGAKTPISHVAQSFVYAPPSAPLAAIKQPMNNNVTIINVPDGL
jgi:hypothetical protein